MMLTVLLPERSENSPHELKADGSLEGGFGCNQPFDKRSVVI